MPARMRAGPRLFAGAVAYIMTARKMKVSATDLFVWLVPSTLVTGTVKWLDTSVSPIRTPRGANPLQLNIGNCTVEINPNSNITPATATTADSSDRLFQLYLAMYFPEMMVFRSTAPGEAD